MAGETDLLDLAPLLLEIKDVELFAFSWLLDIFTGVCGSSFVGECSLISAGPSLFSSNFTAGLGLLLV